MSAILYPFPTNNDKAKQSKYGEGRTDWSSPHSQPDRRKRFPAQETLLGSYLHQQYRIGTRELVPTEKKSKSHKLKGFILTAWNKFGQPTKEDQNVKQNQKLLEHLVGRNLKVEPILTLASNFRWLEDSYYVEGISIQQAEDIATAYGQLAFIALTENKATIRLTTNASFMGLPRETALELSLEAKEVTYNHCPARLPANNKSKCTMVGGPYGSAAIHAAGIWQTTRDQFLRRLGCTPCNKGIQPVGGPGGGAILLNQPDMPSRFGGFQWESAPHLDS